MGKTSKKTKPSQGGALVGGHICAVCGVETTTEWRTCHDLNLLHVSKHVCNRCGCYYNEHRRYRTPNEIRDLKNGKKPKKCGAETGSDAFSTPSPTISSTLPPTPSSGPGSLRREPSNDAMLAAEILVGLRSAPHPQSPYIQGETPKPSGLSSLTDYRPAFAIGPLERPKPMKNRPTKFRQRSTKLGVPRTPPLSALLPRRSSREPRPRPMSLGLEVEVDGLDWQPENAYELKDELISNTYPSMATLEATDISSFLLDKDTVKQPVEGGF